MTSQSPGRDLVGFVGADYDVRIPRGGRLMVRFRLLGRVDLRDDDGTEVRSVLAQPKRLALLAYLAAAGRDSTRRDTALGVFWPELSQERARLALNKATHFLRQALGDDVILSPSSNELAINGDRLWCDVAAFDAAIRAKDSAAAMDVYGGDLLPGLYLEAAPPFDEWLDSERGRLRRAAAQAARSLAEENEHAGKLTLAVNSARRAVELSQTDERVVRELLELLDRLGDRAGALQAYDRFAARLAAEFDAEPSAETKALVERIRVRAEAFASAASGRQLPALAVDQASSSLHERLQEALGTGYTLERELGGGGMARVFVVVERALGRRVVLKVLNPDLVEGVSVARFRQEIQLAAQLAHPHIVPVLSAGVAAGLPYYTMPYVEGESLRKKLEQTGALPIEESVVVLRDVAKALVYAHAHDVVHRDIKPDNVLLAGGSAVVTDFGIAKAIAASRVNTTGAPVTQIGTSLGTPEYMAPEQAAGDRNTNHLADCYSFGAMAFELLAGRPPFHGLTPQALLAAHMNEKPRFVRELRADAPSSLAVLVTQCLEKQPEARPCSSTILESLDRITNGAAPAKHHALLARSRRRRAAVLIGLGVAALIVLQLGLRFLGIGPGTSLLASGAIGENEQLVVADFTTRGGADTVLGPLAAELIRRDLVESKVVGVMASSRVRETLREMRRSPSTPLDLPTALEIAERSGTRAVVHGDITPLGDGFVAVLRLVAAMTGDELALFREVARTPNELIPAVDRLSTALRERIGESLRDVRATPDLLDVTTPSLEALKKYVQAFRADPSRRAIPLLEEAVAIDSNFAMAWRALSARYANFGYPTSARDAAAARAFRARDHLRPRERALVEAYYYLQVVEDRAKAAAIYERLISERGVQAGANEPTNLALLYADRREFDRAELLMRQMVDAGLTPRNMLIYENWPLVLFNQGKIVATDSVIRLAEPQPGTLRLQYMIAMQQLDSAALLSAKLRNSKDVELHDAAWMAQFWIDATKGRIMAAMRALARARQSARISHNDPVLALLDSIHAADIDLLLLGRRDRALRRLNASVIELNALEPIDKPYFQLASSYAKARRPDRARALLSQFDREVRDTLVRRRIEHQRRGALAQIALAERRPLDAVMLFRHADMLPDGPVNACAVCLYLRLGQAFDAAKNADSALFYYERYLTTPFWPGYGITAMKAEAIGWVHYRLGELHERTGNRDSARVHFTKVADLWKDADPELQPRVGDARRRAART